jgi:hypothetical protein
MDGRFESGVCATPRVGRGNNWIKGMVMWLENCSDEEITILACIAALAANLPGPLADYSEAIIQINRGYFKLAAKKLPSRNPAGRSVMTPRKGR